MIQYYTLKELAHSNWAGEWTERETYTDFTKHRIHSWYNPHHWSLPARYDITCNFTNW